MRSDTLTLLFGENVSFWSLMSDSSLQVCWLWHENPLARQCRDTYEESRGYVLFFAEKVGLVGDDGVAASSTPRILKYKVISGTT
jgi:hypothetical protein